MIIKRLFLGVILVGLSFGLALAQGDKAVVVGTVSDTTGAVIPGAEVDITRTATNQTFATITSDTGDFAIRALVSGVYNLRASMPGFKTEVHSGIKLDVGQTYRMNIQLSVGEVSEVVEVASTAPILKTETPEYGQVIDNKKIISIPLNARDVFGVLGSLTPGIQPTQGQGAIAGAVSFNVRGLRRSDNVAMLDGAQVSETNANLQFFANPDALQEFEIKSGLYGVEYGIKPGGQFSAITKTGTNELHGTVFWFHRNDNLDARNFFDPGPRNEFKRNQFGAVVGGPIMLPGLFNGKDKAWWFFSYDGERIRQFRSLTGTVPTAAQRAGTFADPILDPFNNNEPFPNNTIPAGRFDPIASKLGAFWPNPNTEASRGFNFTSASSAPINRNNYIAKMDFQTGPDSRWMGRFMAAVRPLTFVQIIDTFSRINALDNWAQTLTNTRNFGSNVVNEFGFHFFRRPYKPGIPGGGPDGFGPTLGLPNWPKREVDFDGVPVTSVQGMVLIGSHSIQGPVPEGQWEIKDNISWTKGSHYFKAGYHYRYHYVFFGLTGRTRFNVSTPGHYTGNDLANFQLGYLSSAREGNELRLNHNFPSHYFYFQDSWKVSPKLSFQLGMRYELRGGWRDLRGFSSNLQLDCALQTTEPQPSCFDPRQTIGDEAVFPATGRFAEQESIFSWTKNGFQPRIGFSYRLTDNTVLRGGGGLYGNEPMGGMLYSAAALGNPRANAANVDYLSDASFPTLRISNPFDPAAQAGGTVRNFGAGYEDPMPQWYVPNFGLAVQHMLPANTMLEVGYEGTRSVHEMMIWEFNDARPGSEPRIDRRPWPSMTRYQMLLGNGNQTYHAMNLKIEKRPGPEGLSQLLAYTWAKGIDTAGGRSGGFADPPQISRNLYTRGHGAINRGRGEGTIPGRLAWLTGWDVPYGPGRTYGTDSMLGKIFGGWSMYTIVTLQKGNFFTVSDSDRLDVGSSASQRPDLLRDPNFSSSSREPQRWFDTEAFAAPAPHTYGNAGRGIVEGPGIINMDFSLMKEFFITEGTRLEFRFEAFNLTNHTNFRPLTPQFSFTNPNFGVFNRASEARDLQFGFKIYF